MVPLIAGLFILSIAWNTAEAQVRQLANLRDTVTRSRLAISEVDVPRDSAKPRAHLKWVARDSNAIWSHAAPDTGRVMLSMRPYGAFVGYLISRDSNWVVLVNEDGLKQEILTSHVKGVSDWKEVSDTIFHNVGITRPWLAPRFEAYFAPTLLGSQSFPSNGVKPGFGWSASGLFGFRSPHLLYNYLGEFVGLSFESRSFSVHDDKYDNDYYWSVRYVNITPGFSYRGLVNLGVTIGIPASADVQSFASDTHVDVLGTPLPVRTSTMNILVEPRMLLAIPLSFYSANRMLVALIQVGYPLTVTFKDNTIVNGGIFYVPATPLNNLRIPELSIGLSYVLPLFSPFRGSSGLLVD